MDSESTSARPHPLLSAEGQVAVMKACSLSDTVLYQGEGTLQLFPGVTQPLALQLPAEQTLRFAVRIPACAGGAQEISLWLSDDGREMPGTRVSTRSGDTPIWLEIGPILLGAGPHRLAWSTTVGDGTWPPDIEPFYLGRVRLGQAPLNLAWWSHEEEVESWPVPDMLQPGGTPKGGPARAQLRVPELRRIVDTTPALISYIGTDFTYRFVNRAHERWFGHSPAEVPSAHVRDLLGDSVWETVRVQLERALRGETVTFEAELPGRDRPRWVQFVCTPDIEATGRVHGLVALAHDIDDRKRAEEALRRTAERAERLRGVVVALAQALTEEQVAHVIIHQGLQALGAVAGGVTRVTDDGQALAFIEHTGYNPAVIAQWERFSLDANMPLAAAARTRTPIFIGSLAEREQSYPGLPAFLLTGAPGASASIPLTIGDRLLGALVLVWSQATQLTGEDKEFILALAQQCAQALDRAQLYAAERCARTCAEASDRAKDRFLAVLSHELRTPLMPVISAAGMLENDALVTGQVRRLATMIRKNAELEARLIDDLLDLTRVSQGKLSLQLEPVDLHATVRDVLRACAAELESKKLHLELELAAAEHLVCADQARLQQVIWNLVKNAAKFSPAGGHLAIRSTNDTAGRLTLSVADQGIGIEPELLPRIFNAFEQGGSDVTRRYGGLGLGLAISKAFIEAQGGVIAATSQGQGCGATFTIELPLAGEAVRPTPVAVAPEPAPGCRILLVEDHEDTALLLAELLKMHGYTVKTAGTVASALRLADTGTFDLVVSDLGLPDGTGLDLMRQLSVRHGVPGVALSGYGFDTDVRAARAAGFREHITKPVSPAVLLRVLARMLEKDSTAR
jgi:PAS domain S-box-containing protein